jgi:hypothetical protein
MVIDKDTQAAFYIYLEMVKDSRGSRPRGAGAEWFVSLTEAERQAEIQRHIDSVNEMTEFLKAQHKADVKYLQSFGDFSERINST